MPDGPEMRMRNVIDSGDRLQILETMLEMLAERFDRCTPRDSAGISRQIQCVLEEIQEIRNKEGTFADGLDDFVDGIDA